MIIAQNSLLPAVVGRGKGPSALWRAPDILLQFRVRFWLSVELGDVKLAGGEIVPIVPHKRCIGMNRVPSIRRVNSCSLKEASNSEGGALGETKPGIDLIIVDQFDLVGSIGSNIQALNVMENTNELAGVLVILTVLTGSLAELV